MGLNQLYLILILVTSLAYRTSAQVCCGVSSANLVRLGIMEVQLGVERTQRKTEMQWRIAEEKCANKILQDQLTEIQEKLDTHISVCGYDYRFTIDNKESEDFVTVAPYREVFVDNSRVGGNMKKGKELLDPETGMFTVPEDADGEYEFSASLSADTYQDTDEPFNRPAYWAIMKEGKEKEAITEVTSSTAYGDMFSAGIMFGDAGNNMQADTISLSKTVIFSLKAGDKIHLAAIRKDGYFPYAGRFISFCAKLINRDATNVITGVHSTDNPCPVLGPRHDCIPKAGSEKPVEDTSLSTQLGEERSDAAAEAEKDASAAKESGNDDKIQEAEEKKAEIKKEQENDKKKKCAVKKKEKENKKVRKKKEEKDREEKEKEEKCREGEIKAKQDATKESKGEGEKKWYIDKDCETNITVILWKEDEIVKEREKEGNQGQKGNGTIELMDTTKFLLQKQQEMKCEQTRKVNAYNATKDPMLEQDAPVPKCCPAGEKCNEAGEPLGTESDTQAGSTGNNEGGETDEDGSKTDDASKTDDGSTAEDENEEDDGCPQ